MLQDNISQIFETVQITSAITVQECVTLDGVKMNGREEDMPQNR